jgi:hypothetical protein
VLSLLLLIVAAGRAGTTFHRFQRYSHVYGNSSFRDYLFQDLVVLNDKMHRAYYAERAELQMALRADDIRRRAEEDVRQRLLLQLEASSDAEEHERIRTCLARDGLPEMAALAHELEQSPRPESPEIRLNLLLGSLRDFCSSEELDQYRKEALEILRDSGFRTAREFVVQTHRDLSIRAKQMEEEAEKAVSEPDTPSKQFSKGVDLKYKSLKPK